jgi:CheY-like chemotaxis protein
MGLAVVHGIIKSHDGAVAVDSLPGQGAAFHVYLPTILAEVEALPGVIPRTIGGSERILFVDDEKALVQMTRGLLERLGYRVTAFTNPEDALAAFMGNPQGFDLVISDLTMPRMTGDQFGRRIKGVRPSVPVLLSTGASESLAQTKVNEAGVDGYVMKPFQTLQLAAAIRQALETSHRRTYDWA